MNRQKEKYKPLRKCIVCQKRQEKECFFRIVNIDGGLMADEKGTHDGRGCYVCKSSDCISLIEKKSAVGRSFKKKFSSENYQTLITVLWEAMKKHESHN